jgi:hypothetical protein
MCRATAFRMFLASNTAGSTGLQWQGTIDLANSATIVEAAFTNRVMMR